MPGYMIYMLHRVGSDQVLMWHQMQGSAREEEWTFMFIHCSWWHCM